MPFTLPPLSRRQFLAASTLAALSAAQARGAGEATRDPHRFVLMADTHIPSAPDIAAHGVKMHDNFVMAAKSVLALERPASAAMILGDCAYLTGKQEDYALLVKVLEPLRSAGLPIHLLLGNHDHRERFWEALPADDARDKAVEAKHVMVVESPRANWVLLDSLDATNKTPGVLGKEQLAWLAKTLDAHADRPTLVCLHHNPDHRPMPGGLTDTQPLYDVLLPRKQVKALFFGHTHNWEIKQQDGLHLVNLPPVAYVFAKGKPSGFVEVELADEAATLRLHTHADDHPLRGQEIKLDWRS